MRRFHLHKVVAGGQTGVDQAALTVATKLGLQTGGWCPSDYTDENRSQEEQFKTWGLQPVTASLWEEHRERFQDLGVEYKDGDKWARRGLMNVLQSSGTLTILPGVVADGTNLALNAAKALGRSSMILDMCSNENNRRVFELWIQDNTIDVLNINGPRESSHSGIYSQCIQLFEDLFSGITLDNKR